MTAVAIAWSEGKEIGKFAVQIGKKMRLKELERDISKRFGGEEFRKITLIEDFMRMVFSSEITVPVKICKEANLLSLLNLHECIRVYFLFERREVHFDISNGQLEEESGEKEIKEALLNSGHYLGTYAMPCYLSIEDQNDFVNRRKRLPVKTDGLGDEIRIKAYFKRKKLQTSFKKETNFLDVATAVFDGLNLNPDSYFRVFKGDRDACLLSVEFPPHSMVQGFSFINIGEMAALMGDDFSIDHEMERVVNLEVIR